MINFRVEISSEEQPLTTKLASSPGLPMFFIATHTKIKVAKKKIYIYMTVAYTEV